MKFSFRLRCLLVNLERAFQLGRFLFAVFSCFAALLINTDFDFLEFGALDCFAKAVSYNYVFMLYFFAAIPYAASYLEEIRNHYAYLYLDRAGWKGYLADKVIAVFLSGSFSVMAGCVLYLLLLTRFTPLIGSIEISSYSGYEELILQGQLMWYLVVKIGILSISAGTVAVLSFLCSGWFRSLLVVYGCPLVIFFVWVSAGQLCNLPDCVMINWLIALPVLSRMETSILYTVLFFILIMVLACIVCFPHMRRRLENE